MVKPISEYRRAIKQAQSKQELDEISFNALKNDDECTVFSKKYDKIIDMCVRRSEELQKS